MTIQIRPVDPVSRPLFAGEVSGIDITKPLTPDQASAIEAGMDQYGVLVFHGQKFDDETQLAFWHSDSSFKEVPAKFSLLSARLIPSAGGNTEFADMRAAYDTLDDETKGQIEDLVCEHSQLYSRSMLGFTDFTDEDRIRFRPVLQRLVRRHPSTGRKSLYLASHAGTIVGWPVPEARALLRDLIEHATQRSLVYPHEWQQWDLVMWDNRATMHRARPFDATKVRDMRRTTVACERSTMAEAA
jgi:alpha-ketoglutarate-dependent 2,4-dichlorophenoxyacetate dioxygenase